VSAVELIWGVKQLSLPAEVRGVSHRSIAVTEGVESRVEEVHAGCRKVTACEVEYEDLVDINNAHR
jgi:hypothetical protein